MKIITIRQPFASALLTGTYDAERRKYRLSGPTLIHATAKPGMSPDACAKWLHERDGFVIHTPQISSTPAVLIHS